MKYITDINKLDITKKYTYADYLTWQFQERIELIMGKIFRMSPAPSEIHQKVSFNITRAIIPYTNENPCNIYYAPFDVRLIRQDSVDEKEIISVVQPDIVIICDESKIDDKGCLGAPDILFEILSKSTRKKDLHEKYTLYESSGVREYWIIDPIAETVQINASGNDRKYIPGKLLTKGDVAESMILTGLTIDLDEVFPSIVEEPEEPYGPEVERI
ncbi:Uma2 family endonuclease [Bacteroidota bacterium]